VFPSAKPIAQIFAWRHFVVRRIIRNLPICCALLFLLASFPTVGRPQDKKVAHLPGSNPVSGSQLYKRYCAVRHGNDLKGNGPISPEFKNPPSDLTTLAQRHEGKFPDEYVQDVLRNGVEKPAHASTEMPIWGRSSRRFPGRIRSSLVFELST
jgi:mono/diheme cytochrome c family protein